MGGVLITEKVKGGKRKNEMSWLPGLDVDPRLKQKRTPSRKRIGYGFS